MQLKPKYSYLLLELLIAFSLLTICSLPLIQTPLFFLKKDIVALEKMELQHLADLAFSELKAQLHQHQIPWQLLSIHSKPEIPYSKKIFTLSLEKIAEHQFEQSCYLWSASQTQTKNGDDHRLLKIQVQFSSVGPKRAEFPISYLYDVYLKQEKNKPSDEKDNK